MALCQMDDWLAGSEPFDDITECGDKLIEEAKL